jgi:hypothetical protein
VPFVSKPPRGDGGVGERPDAIQLTDVMALVLERLGLPRPDGIQSAVPPNLGRPLMAESYVLAALYPHGDWLTVFDGDWKYMWNSKGTSELYRLDVDPRETQNLIAAQPDRALAMERTMRAYLDALPRVQEAGPARAVDDATRDALKSLGYIH